MTYSRRFLSRLRSFHFTEKMMKSGGTKLLCALLAFFMAASLAACRSLSDVPLTHRRHPSFQYKMEGISLPKIMPPHVEIYNMTTGDVRELREDWTETAEGHVLASLSDGLEKAGVSAQIQSVEDEAIQEELDEIFALFEAVDMAIKMHAYPQSSMMFPAKVDSFEYSLGPVEHILSAFGADAMILFRCEDHISSRGRKVLMVTSKLTGLLTGHQVLPGSTHATMALVNGEGEILWYNFSYSRGHFDLREAESADELIGTMIHYLPEQYP